MSESTLIEWLFVAVVWAGGAFTAGLSAAAWYFSRNALAKSNALHAAISPLISAAAVGGVIAIVQAIMLVAVGVGFFGLIHLGAATATLTALALAVIAGMRGLWRRSLQDLAVGSAAACAVLLAVYAMMIEPYRLETVQVAFDPPNPGAPPLRVAVIADIQTDEACWYERYAVQRAVELKPDLIVLPGDIVQARPAQLQELIEPLGEVLSRLSAPLGVFACLGNTDPPALTAELLGRADVQLLSNEVVELTHAGRRIALGGLEWNWRSSAAASTVERLAATPADLRILLCHTPDGVRLVSPSQKIDLVICGHTHGGQVVVPGFGPLLNITRLPRAVAAGGLHEVDGQHVYVSRGVGHERGTAPPVRFWCRPELTLLEIRGAEPASSAQRASEVAREGEVEREGVEREGEVSLRPFPMFEHNVALGLTDQ